MQLSLSSFHAITDYSIVSLMKQLRTLRQITLVDMPQISDRLVTKAVAMCVTDNSRRLHLTLSDEQMSKRVRRRHHDYPANLRVNFDSHLCGKQLADTEPTDVQMILVILMSAIILGMTLLTTIVVVLVPLSMLLMMAHEWLFELVFSRYESFGIPDSSPPLLQLFSSSAAGGGGGVMTSSITSDTTTVAAGPTIFLGFFTSFIRKLMFSLQTLQKEH